MTGRIDILRAKIQNLEENQPQLVAAISDPGEFDGPGRESQKKHNDKLKQLREELEKETGSRMSSGGRTMP